MVYTAEMTFDNMIYMPSCMKIGCRFQVILRLLPRQSEMQQC
jgi:hypothetical protein